MGIPAELAVEELTEVVEQLAYRWQRQAKELDPEWPDYDEKIVYDSQEHENQGTAAGLRQAAGELLTLIDR